jgi:IclR family transcriptional regulator, KDG regulon repressor
LKKESTDSEIVKSIVRAANIIKCLNDGENRLIYMGAKLNLSKSTMHRLLKTLENSGFVTQDPVNRRYYFGPLLINLVNNPAMHQYLILSSLDEMSHLRDKVDETVSIHMRVGIHKVIIEELVSSQGAKVIFGKGHVEAVTNGAGGRVLLSELKEREVDLILKNLVSNGTVNSSECNHLHQEISLARNQGYFIFNSQPLGIYSIGVPIKNYLSQVTLTVVGPRERFNITPAIINDIQRTADNISQKLFKFKQ